MLLNSLPRHLALCAACLCLGQTVVYSETVLRVDPAQQWGQWEGWGTSLCWWAGTPLGDRDDVADILFTTNVVSFEGKQLPGLGLNIVRYNAGACSTQSVDGAVMVVSPKIASSRQIEGFWLDGRQTNVASRGWTWSADPHQRSMLLKAKARGANRFELFSNSPMWWMCANHNPSGSGDGKTDNLPPEHYRDHVFYMASIARHAADEWGIRFDSVEPFNEPISTWWKADGTQEGCRFSTQAQVAVIRELRVELDRQGLKDVLVSASDENKYDQALEVWNALGKTQELVGRVNVHGYQYAHGDRDGLRRAVKGKTIWNSEYGQDDVSGLKLARNLSLDVRRLHIAAWCYWQPFDVRGWGLIQSWLGNGWIGPVNPSFYVLAHYSRNIRPGMELIDAGGDNGVAAYDKANRRLVIVAVEPEDASSLTFDLSAFSKAGGPVRRWLTVTDEGPKYEAQPSAAIAEKRIVVAFPKHSVQTLEIENVDR